LDRKTGVPRWEPPKFAATALRGRSTDASGGRILPGKSERVPQLRGRGRGSHVRGKGRAFFEPASEHFSGSKRTTFRSNSNRNRPAGQHWAGNSGPKRHETTSAIRPGSSLAPPTYARHGCLSGIRRCGAGPTGVPVARRGLPTPPAGSGGGCDLPVRGAKPIDAGHPVARRGAVRGLRLAGVTRSAKLARLPNARVRQSAVKWIGPRQPRDRGSAVSAVLMPQSTGAVWPARRSRSVWSRRRPERGGARRQTDHREPHQPYSCVELVVHPRPRADDHPGDGTRPLDG